MRCCGCWSWSLVCITVQQTCTEVSAEEEKSMRGWRGDRRDLMTLTVARGQGAEAWDDERSSGGIKAESRWRGRDVRWREVEIMVLVWLKDVIRDWNDAAGINLSILKIKMIGRSRSRQASRHSAAIQSSSALSDREATSALLQSQKKKKVLWGRGESAVFKTSRAGTNKSQSP